MELSTEEVIDHADVEAELADVLRAELADLQLDDDVSQLLNMEEQQVDVEVFAVDLDMLLPVNEGPAGTEFAQDVDDLVYQGLLEVALGNVRAQPEEVEDIRVFRQLLGKLRVRSRALPGPARSAI